MPTPIEKVIEERVCFESFKVIHRIRIDGKIETTMEVFTYNDSLHEARYWMAVKLRAAADDLDKLNTDAFDARVAPAAANLKDDPFAPNILQPANPPALSERISDTTREGLDNARFDQAEYTDWAGEKNL